MRIVSKYLYQIQRTSSPGLIALKNNHTLYAPRAYTLAALKDQNFVRKLEKKASKKECYDALVSHHGKITEIYMAILKIDINMLKLV